MPQKEIRYQERNKMLREQSRTLNQVDDQRANETHEETESEFKGRANDVAGRIGQGKDRRTGAKK